MDRLDTIGSSGGGGRGRGRNGGGRREDGTPKDDSKLKCFRCDELGHRKADCTKKFAGAAGIPPQQQRPESALWQSEWRAEASPAERLDWRAPAFQPVYNNVVGAGTRQTAVCSVRGEEIAVTCTLGSAMAAAIGAALIKAHTPEAGASAAGQAVQAQQPAKSEALDVKPAPDTSSQSEKAAAREERQPADEGKMPAREAMQAVSALLNMQDKSDEVGYGAERASSLAVAAVKQGSKNPCQTRSSNPLKRPNMGVAPGRQGSNKPPSAPKRIAWCPP